MDAICSVQSTTIDNTELESQGLDINFLYNNEEIQWRARYIAKKFKINGRCSSCFLVGVQLFLALIKWCELNFDTLHHHDAGEKYKNSYLNIYTLFKNCGKYQYVCSVCTDLVCHEMYDFVQTFSEGLMFAKFGFIKVVVNVYIYLQKTWTSCRNGCYPWYDVPAGNYNVKCCMNNAVVAA